MTVTVQWNKPEYPDLRLCEFGNYFCKVHHDRWHPIITLPHGRASVVLTFKKYYGSKVLMRKERCTDFTEFDFRPLL